MYRRIRMTVSMSLLAALVMGGCEQTSTPVRRDILGSWSGIGLAGVTVGMTVTETARAVDGAGAWTEDGVASAFRVFGALARQEVSLYLDFSDREDITFQGRFVGPDQIDGVLNGAGFLALPITFIRVTPSN